MLEIMRVTQRLECLPCTTDAWSWSAVYGDGHRSNACSCAFACFSEVGRAPKFLDPVQPNNLNAAKNGVNGLKR